METGNIVFVLQEKPHEIFTRAAADLSAHVSVTLSEALCGFSRIVLKHLDGRGISITHPRGKSLKQGQVLKISGEGMPYKKGDHRGDLYLTIDIEFPSGEWLSQPGNVDKLQALLPKPAAKPLEAEVVDNVEFDPTASMEAVRLPFFGISPKDALLISFHSLVRTMRKVGPLGLTMMRMRMMMMTMGMHNAPSSNCVERIFPNVFSFHSSYG